VIYLFPALAKKKANPDKDKPQLPVHRSSEAFVNRFPFLYSKTEELVWKWEQSKLCGQSINTTLQSTIMPQDHPSNRPDRAGKFVSMQNGSVIVMPPAYLTNLRPEEYQVGFLHAGNLTDMQTILLGLPDWKRPSKVRESMLRFENLLAGKSFPLFYNWSSEYWISDSVILDPRSTDEIEMISMGKRAASSYNSRYLCAGLPSTTMGPLFNTLVTSGNADPACFEYSMGFIWIHVSIDPKNFEIELDTSIDTSCNPVDYMLQQMGEKSWLVQAKLAMKLEGSSRVKAAISVQVLGVSQVRVTSTHKPITHQ
jgi:hypothetical protein